MTYWSKFSDQGLDDALVDQEPPKRRREQPSLKARAVQYLARRDYSRLELRDKLLRYVDSEDQLSELEQVLNELESRKYLSDERYAHTRARLRSSRFGNARIEFELRRQGLDNETVKQALEPLESEFDRAKALWLKRFKGKRPEDFKEKTKQVRFLASRGFSFDVVQQVIASDCDDDYC